MRSLALLLVVLSLGLFAVGCGGPADPPIDDGSAEPVEIEPAGMSDDAGDEEVVVEDFQLGDDDVERFDDIRNTNVVGPGIHHHVYHWRLLRPDARRGAG